jgi:hypothetical protein
VAGRRSAISIFEDEPGRRSVVLPFYFLLLFDGPGWGAVTHFVVGPGARLETVLRHRQRNTRKQRCQKRDNLQGGHLHTLLTPKLTQTRR